MAKKRSGQPTGKPRRRMCGAMQVHQWLLERHSGFRNAQARLEQECGKRLRAGRRIISDKVYRIQCVVHVVYKNESQNVGDAQIQSQLAALNKDYRGTNGDRSRVPDVWKGLAADSRIEFVLAAKDPAKGKTTGITWTKTSVSGFIDDDSVKSASAGGANPWPTDCYLNIWVCNLADGLLGYAQFPGGPRPTDGVVILHSAFGTNGTASAPFNKGRTTTHEVGHFLNLRHIWGDTEDCSGPDYVADTPGQQKPNYGKPAFPHISCSNGPHGDMFMNYMDYVDDEAMFMFSLGQVARMHTTLDGPRRKLVS